ncbi:MAG: alanine racemase [Synergistaceae bacterium]|jgi:alanine racemase|nr:alanine racemase [Synergistaceae bacterium]
MNLRQTMMEVSLENYRHNFRAIRENAGGAKVIAVIKSNAYGMGAVPVAWTLKDEGADFFAVATPDEAITLREAGITDSILVMGTSPYDAAETYVSLGISAVITDMKMAKALSRAAQKIGRPAKAHLKVDTGMGRVGFLREEALDAARRLHSLPGIDFEGIMTHFARADEGDTAPTRQQFAIFESVAKEIRGAGIHVRMAHCCNSGAMLANLSDMYMDAVRPGHILHGLIPAPECGDAIPIKPCFEIKSAIGLVRELPAGTGISYGSTYKTSGPELVAIIPAGYGDGYDRGLSNKGCVLIQGKRCPIRGRICMDQFVVDISHLEDPKVGDEVVLIGRQGGQEITISEVAEKLSTATGAIPVSFTDRMPRVYV